MNSLNFERELFGGKIQALIYDPPEGMDDILDEMYSEALRLQKIFNFFDSESELSLLNRKRQLKVSPDLLRVLKKSLKFAKLTNGKYDPTIGKLILQRKSREKEKPLGCSYKDVKIALNKVTLKNPDAFIDLGSIAKGYITDKLAEFLKSKGVKEFIINSRGDMVFSGSVEHVIGIQDPRDKLKSLMKLKLRNQSAATSGDYGQFYGSFEKSHIINQEDLASITVLSEKLEDADVLATALFVLNGEERKKLAGKFPKAKVLEVDRNLSYKYRNNFQELIHETKN